MPKLDETTTAVAFFRVDNVPYQKGDYVLTLNIADSTLEIRPKTTAIASSGNKILNVEPTGFADWTTASDSAYASFAALQSAVEGVGFLG